MKEIHETLRRLYEVAGTTKNSEIAFKLNISPTTVTNWAKRGVSKDGAIQAGKVYQADVGYILHGKSMSSMIKEHSPTYTVTNKNLSVAENSRFYQTIGNGNIMQTVDNDQKIVFYPTPAFNVQENLEINKILLGNLTIQNVFMMRVCDDYLQPIIHHQAIAIIDKNTANKPIYDGKIYALKMDNNTIRCRYLEQLSGNRIRVYSEKDKDGEILPHVDFEQHYHIMGGVVGWTTLVNW